MYLVTVPTLDTLPLKERKNARTLDNIPELEIAPTNPRVVSFVNTPLF
jgi:hypothetical protein